MDTMMERVSDVVGASATSASSSVGSLNVNKYWDVGTEAGMVVFKMALALMKRNEQMLLALDFEPLLEFLKCGVFDIYLASAAAAASSTSVTALNGTMASSALGPAAATSLSPGSTAAAAEGLSAPSTPNQTRKKSGSGWSAATRTKPVPKEAIDELIRDALSIRHITKKKLGQLKKEYEDELKRSDPAYLAEKSLQEQNQRLMSDLKRAEKMLDALNKDHVDLAGQMVTLRVEMAKEKEVSDVLRRQVSDLKDVLKRDLQKLNREDLEDMLEHEVSVDTVERPLPSVELDDKARIPTEQEQIAQLTKQNVQLLEEAHHWRVKAEQMEKDLREVRGLGSGTISGSGSSASANGATKVGGGVLDGTWTESWKKRLGYSQQ